MTITAFVLGARLNGLWVARSLGRHGVPVYLVDNRTSDIAYRSRYASGVIRLPKQDVEHQVDRFIEEAERLGHRPALFITSDYYLQMVASHRERFARAFRINVPDQSTADAVVNKRRFAAFCAEHGIAAPRGWEFTDERELIAMLPQIKFPVAVKPALSYEWGGRRFVETYNVKKMRLVRSPHELQTTYTELGKLGAGLAVQEYIPGRDDQHYSYMEYRGLDGKPLASLCVRKFRILPIHRGVGTFAQVTTDPKIAARARGALDHLNYPGFASVCFKYDVNRGEPLIYEINGRLPMVHSAFQAAGVDLPWLMYQDLIGHPTTPPRVRYPHAKWISLRSDVRALRQYRRAGELTIPQWLRSLWGVRLCVEFAHDDPGTLFYMVKRLFQPVATRVFQSRGSGRRAKSGQNRMS